jgi:hypothetical protein
MSVSERAVQAGADAANAHICNVNVWHGVPVCSGCGATDYDGAHRTRAVLEAATVEIDCPAADCEQVGWLGEGVITAVALHETDVPVFVRRPTSTDAHDCAVCSGSGKLRVVI